MKRRQVKSAWELAADTYSSSRRADGEDATLVEDLCAQLPRDAVVLDVGCGDGRRTLEKVNGPTAIGLDFARRQIELAGQNVPDARLIQGDMLSIPVAEDSVDAITAYHAVFHVDRTDHDDVYEEFARVLRPGGKVLLTVGSAAYEQVRPDWLNSGESMFFSTPGKGATTASLQEAGFDIVWERRVDDPLGSTVPFVLAELAR